MATDTAEGEFRVPEDVEAEQAAHAAEAAQAAEATQNADAAGDTDGDEATEPGRRRRRRRERPAPPTPAEVDLQHTPGTVVAAVALGVVTAPLLGVYAVLFITRWFLQPGVSPDITSSWTGEGLSGILAAVLAIAMLVIVARAAGGRGLPVFVGAQLLVLATCGYLLSDSGFGGRSVTVAVTVLAAIATVCALVPVSRRWFAAHAADRAASA